MDSFSHWADVVGECFKGIGEYVRVKLPQLCVNVRVWPSSGAYPLSVYVSFWSGDPSDDELVVVSAKIWHGRSVFRRECYILVDNDDDLMEMPFVECCDDVDDVVLGRWVARVVSEAMEWSVSHEGDIVSLLAERVGTPDSADVSSRE